MLLFPYEFIILCHHRIYTKVEVTLLEVSLLLPHPPNFFNLTIPTGGDSNLHGSTPPLATTVATELGACSVLSEAWQNQLPAAFSSFRIQLTVSGHSVTIIWVPHSAAFPVEALGSQSEK